MALRRQIYCHGSHGEVLLARNAVGHRRGAHWKAKDELPDRLVLAREFKEGLIMMDSDSKVRGLPRLGAGYSSSVISKT